MSQGNLSPWRAFRYFQAPRESYPVIPTGKVVQITPAEVFRVTLMIGLTDLPAPFYIGTSPAIATGKCLAIVASNSPFVLTHAEHGALVQVAWYAANLGAPDAPLYVLEQLLIDWPLSRPGRNPYE